ncbi:MAG: aminoacyl-tRNA hydrolase [Acidobacteria bacterium]|nr:MAG: aminoacyl-tRNA hydrolase [Acidobacteriota bacterium]PYV70696.1 MAG: aminoacyl-tRNA hydrolase [Acidobacteriota bacterium]PYV78529.1 MAG: aminoacyl-tRNA hydrolase [Acidobacteriota bacterium]
MKLIVGLGNPGPEYELTPHNLGFLVVDRIADEQKVEVRNRQCRALTARTVIEQEQVILAKPETFMNLSGAAVRELVSKLEIVPETDLIVIQDELDLPFGILRIHRNRSSAGHNGIESIINSLGTKDFPRIRIGVAPERKVEDGKEYLLSPMRKAQLKMLDPIIVDAAEAAAMIVKEGPAVAMQRFNRREPEESSG